MTKILLVDDEDYIRQGIRYSIPWEEHGIQVVGEASNGSDALQLAIKTNADIVLADIQMPVMGGLELAGELHTLLPRTKVIILTAYGNTENLTNAIDVKVCGFLLKNADSDSILKKVLEIKKELDQERHAHDQIEQITHLFDENKQLIKATLFTRFLENQISYSHFIEKGSPMGIHTQAASYALVVIKCSCIQEKRALSQLWSYFSPYHPFCFFTKHQIATCVLDTTHTPLEKSDFDQILPSLMPLAFGNSIALMHHIASLEDMPFAYSILSQALEHSFWNPQIPYTLLSPSNTLPPKKTVDTYPHEQSIIQAVITKNQEQIKTAFDTYYTYVSSQKISRQQYLDSIMRLIIPISAVFSEDFSISSIEDLLCELETPTEILELTISLTNYSPPKDVGNTQMNLVLEYLEEHCCEPLYLEDAAKKVYLSPGYLSRIFKASTGYTFKEYIHKLRIQKAQQLIRETNLKYYEIAEMVGYKIISIFLLTLVNLRDAVRKNIKKRFFLNILIFCKLVVVLIRLLCYIKISATRNGEWLAFCQDELSS